MTTIAQPLPRLAPPGAGIPAIERLVGGTIFALKRRLGTRERFQAEFTRSRAQIADLVTQGDADSNARRVLIPRLRGLEDSSRFWSVFMTLDHLQIVNEQIARVIRLLADGITPPERAGTAAVKPREGVGPEVRPAYEASCDALLASAAGVPDLRTPARYAHPWFGPLDAAGWHAMAAMHMGIHKAQIARIIALRDAT